MLLPLTGLSCRYSHGLLPTAGHKPIKNLLVLPNFYFLPVTTTYRHQCPAFLPFFDVLAKILFDKEKKLIFETFFSISLMPRIYNITFRRFSNILCFQKANIVYSTHPYFPKYQKHKYIGICANVNTNIDGNINIKRPSLKQTEIMTKQIKSHGFF